MSNEITSGNNRVRFDRLIFNTGDESINGIKTFVADKNPKVRLMDKSIPSGRGFPTGNDHSYPRLEFYANGNNQNKDRLGALQYSCYTTANDAHIVLFCCNPDNHTSEEYSQINIGYKKDANDVFQPYTSILPSPSADSNDNQIATTKWVNDACVHKTNNETVDGIKTFNSEIRINKSGTNIRHIHSGLTFGTYPAEQTSFYTSFEDKTGTSKRWRSIN